MKIILWITGMFLFVVSLTQVACFAAQTAVISVKPDIVIGDVNPFLYGNNLLAYQRDEEYSARGAGVWDPEKGKPVPEYVTLAKQAGITLARWPGGCESHRYNWKLAVGPHAQRPKQPFGLPEFLIWCEAVGARPIITIAEYWGEAQDAADLVEYLNAPNDGKHRWAALRADDGHPEPYRVIWFEYGNESDHGDHGEPKTHIFNPAEYGQRYLAYQKAMKAIDPSVKLGAVLGAGNGFWDPGVLRVCGKEMDFGIAHTYVPQYNTNDNKVPGRQLMQACVAADDAMQSFHDWLNKLVLEACGRRDIPWAITEYNGMFVQEKPAPYRQSLGNALRNAENLRIMMRPRNRIMCANFWQYANEYWGMIRGHVDRHEPLIKQANYYIYQLYHEHFGDTLIQADVQCDAFDFAGAAGVGARFGKSTEFKLFEPDLLKDKNWKTGEVRGVKQTLQGDIVIAEFQNQDVNYYAPALTMPAEANTGYRLTAWIKTEDLKSSTGAGIQVGDGRGWLATRSCGLGGNVTGTMDWTKVVVDYVTLKDTTSLLIQARRLENGGPATGKAMYRIEKIQKFTPANAGAVPYISCNAAMRKDGAITLMLMNKNFDEDIQATVEIAGASKKDVQAHAWSLTGPSETATNLGDGASIGIHETAAEIVDGKVKVLLPKCSLTAIEIK